MKEAALITGASRGIGRELTRCLARDGKNCVIVSRSEGELRDVKSELESRYGTSIRVISKDLSRPAASEELVETLASENIYIHTLINNAGFGNYGQFSDHDWTREFELLQLNIICLTQLTHLLLEPMLERGKGWIMNVASTAAYVPGPYMSTYYASKAYVLSFTEGLANEVKSRGVRVTALCPGFTETDFQKNAGVSGTGLIDRIPFKASPEAVAEYGINAMQRGKVVAVHGYVNKLAIFLLRFLPGFLIRWTLGSIQGGPLREKTKSEPDGGKNPES